MFSFISRTYKVMGIAATIGGAIGLLQWITSQDEFSLTLSKTSESSIVTIANNASDIKILYNNQPVNSVYSSHFTLENTGKKALIKDFIFNPILLAPPALTTIYQVKPTQPEVSLADSKITLKWELLNPGEKISFEVLSSTPYNPKITARIREIPKISFRDEITDPPPKSRLERISALWLAAALLAIIALIDSIRLVANDAKLQTILSLSKNTPQNSISKQEFKKTAIELYSEYFESTPRLLVSPESFAKQIGSEISDEGLMSEDALKVARTAIIHNARFANLYTMRSMGIIYAPLTLGFCLARVIVALYL